MTLEEIKAATLRGKTVCVGNDGYEVRNVGEQWLIVFLPNSYTIGLTWLDGKTMNGRPEEFYIRKDVIIGSSEVDMPIEGRSRAATCYKSGAAVARKVR